MSFYAIILDRLDGGSRSSWSVAVKTDTLQAARATQSFGGFFGHYRKSEWDGERLETKSGGLHNRRTGNQEAPASIYRLTAK